MKQIVWRSCSALALGVLSAQSALAQTSGDATSGESAGALGEIIVTAERRPEDLQDTPVSVMAYSGQALERRGVDSLDELQSFVPNTSIGGSVPNGGGAPDFSIRGVGQTSARANSEKGVGLYIDDIYYPRAVGSFLNLDDTQRIEVLRGPQGTLFGRNTTGGAIRYFTNRPVHDFEARLSATTGSYERRDFNALLNVPLGDLAALRVQVANFYREGYVDVIGEDRAYGDQEDYAAHAQLLFEPSDDISIRLIGGYSSGSSLGDPIVIKAVGNGTTPLVPVINAYNLYLGSLVPPISAIVANDPRWVSPSDDAVANHCVLDALPRVAANFGPNVTQLSNALAEGGLCRELKNDETVFAAADIEWRLSDQVTLRSLSGYNKGSHIDQGDYGLLGVYTNAIVNDNESFSQEFQLTGDFDMVDLVAGVFYFRETPVESTINRQIITNPPAGPPNPNAGMCCIGFDRTLELETNSYAVFGQATFNITEQFGITAGARYTHDEKEVVVTKTGIFAPNVPAASPTELGNRRQTGADEWEAVDWRATVHYDWTDDLMTYVTASRGFKSGGFGGDITVVGPAPFSYVIEPYDPEIVTNYEVGLRSEWFNNRFRANLTAFDMMFDDMVVQFADFTGGGLTLRFLNAGEVELRGVEGEFELAATDELIFFANFGYTDLEYQNLDNNSPLFRRGVGTCPLPPPPPPAPQVPATFALCGDTAQPLTRTPEWTYAFGLDFSHMAAGGAINANASYSFQDEIFSGNSTQNAIPLEAYGVTNVRLEYDSLENWRVAIFGTNVFDENYYTAGFNGIFQNSPIGTVWKSPGRPAEWGARLTLRY